MARQTRDTRRNPDPAAGTPRTWLLMAALVAAHLVAAGAQAPREAGQGPAGETVDALRAASTAALATRGGRGPDRRARAARRGGPRPLGRAPHLREDRSRTCSWRRASWPRRIGCGSSISGAAWRWASCPKCSGPRSSNATPSRDCFATAATSRRSGRPTPRTRAGSSTRSSAGSTHASPRCWPSASQLPVEFQLTGSVPEPWTPDVVISRMAGYIMTRGARTEVQRAQLAARVGASRVAEFLPPDPPVPITRPAAVSTSPTSPTRCSASRRAPVTACAPSSARTGRPPCAPRGRPGCRAGTPRAWWGGQPVGEHRGHARRAGDDRLEQLGGRRPRGRCPGGPCSPTTRTAACSCPRCATRCT